MNKNSIHSKQKPSSQIAVILALLGGFVFGVGYFCGWLLVKVKGTQFIDFGIKVPVPIFFGIVFLIFSYVYFGYRYANRPK